MKLKKWVKKQGGREEGREEDRNPFPAFIQLWPFLRGQGHCWDSRSSRFRTQSPFRPWDSSEDFFFHATYDDMLQMDGSEDNWPDSKEILCLPLFLYLEGAITKGLHWKQTGRLGGRTKSKPPASPSWTTDDLIYLIDLSDSLRQPLPPTVFPWFQKGLQKVQGTHVCLPPGLPQPYSKHPNSCQDVIGPPPPSSSPLLHLLLQLAPGLLIFMLLAVSITYQVLSASGPLPRSSLCLECSFLESLTGLVSLPHFSVKMSLRKISFITSP